MKRTLFTTIAAAVAVAVAPSTAIAAPSSSTVTSYCFQKRFTGTQEAPAWVGTWGQAAAGGTCDASSGGTLTSAVTGGWQAGSGVLGVTITWRFLRADGRLLFETLQHGTLDLTSGAVVLDGTVTSGARKGAATHDEGHPTDGSGSYAGVMQVGAPTHSRAGGLDPAVDDGCVGGSVLQTEEAHLAYLDAYRWPAAFGGTGESAWDGVLALADENGNGRVCVALGVYWTSFPEFPNSFFVTDDDGDAAAGR